MTHPVPAARALSGRDLVVVRSTEAAPVHYRFQSLGLRGASALLLSLSAICLTGCAGYYYGEKYGPTLSLSPNPDMVGSSYAAADALLQNAPLDPRAPVLVATLVDLDHLGASSRFGRVVSEQIAGRLTQRGLPVPELRLRESVALVPQEGALLLSRELREVSRAHAAQAVVVGTYAVSSRQVFVSLKLVRPEGNVTIAAHDYALVLDDELRSLLGMR